MFSKKKSKTAKTTKRPKSTPELDRAAALRKFQAEPRPQREAPGTPKSKNTSICGSWGQGSC